jgi:hypothetical protein
VTVNKAWREKLCIIPNTFKTGSQRFIGAEEMVYRNFGENAVSNFKVNILQITFQQDKTHIHADTFVPCIM